MPRYKLTKVQDDGSLLMGDAMFAYLESIGFSVPVKVPLVRVVQVLPKPVVPATRIVADWMAYDAAASAYKLERAEVVLENTKREIAYHKQFSDFANVLRELFVIATGTYDKSTYPHKWIYAVLPEAETKYTFEQCAGRLMGQYTVGQMSNPLQFIAYQNF